MDELYVEVTEICDGVVIPLATRVVQETLQYCSGQGLFKLYIVAQESSVDYRSEKLGINAEWINLTALPLAVKHCGLPAIIWLGSPLITSGLCCVLRSIIEKCHDLDPKGHLDDLLGYKRGCLKACAEVSAWTKFCEVDLPSAAENLIKTHRVLSGNSDCTVRLPVELCKLEAHLGTQPILANRNKHIQKARKEKNKRGTKNTAEEKQLKGKAHTEQNGKENTLHTTSDKMNSVKVKENATNKDPKTEPCSDSSQLPQEMSVTTDCCPELEHKYAEGPDRTLTDLILFTCLHPVLSNWQKCATNYSQILPRINRWHQRLVQDYHKGEPPTDPSNPVYSVTLEIPAELLISQLDIRESTEMKFKMNNSIVEKGLQSIQNTSLIKSLMPHTCEDVRLDWASLPASAHPAEGKLPAKRVQRKCEQLESMVAAVRQVAQPGDTIVDFCAGGGHLGIVIACVLPQCQVVLVENKEESLRGALRRIEELKLNNINIYQCNLGYFRGDFDVGTCLHACGTATDMVLDQCMDKKAAFVVCPCCYGAVRDTHTMRYPRSQAFKKTSLKLEEYYQIGHAADKTEVNIPAQETGKQCMLVIDSDRCLAAEEQGYSVTLTTLVPPTASPKNHILIGELGSR